MSRFALLPDNFKHNTLDGAEVEFDRDTAQVTCKHGLEGSVKKTVIDQSKEFQWPQ